MKHAFRKSIRLAGMLFLALSLAGCNEASPKKCLDDAAKALTAKDSGAFLAQLDVNAFAGNEIANLKLNNKFLKHLYGICAKVGCQDKLNAILDMASDPANRKTEALAQAFGALSIFLDRDGEFSELIDRIVNIEGRTVSAASRMVSSGELVNMCTKAQTPDCPWVPQSLSSAVVKNIDDSHAVAKVTTPASMTSWLALRKQGDAWKIVGKAILEEDAASYSLGMLPAALTSGARAR